MNLQKIKEDFTEYYDLNWSHKTDCISINENNRTLSRNLEPV